MEFIRLEHPQDGHGIFRTPSSNRWNLSDSPIEFKVNLMPTPWHENRCINNDEFCGFPSLDVMEKWIPKDELHIMITNGIKVYVITGETTFNSDNQVFFKKTEIKNQHDITDLFID